MQAYDLQTNDKDREGKNFFILFLSEHKDLFDLVKELQAKGIVYGYRAFYNISRPTDGSPATIEINRVDQVGIGVAKVYDIKNARYPVTIEDGLL